MKRGVLPVTVIAAFSLLLPGVATATTDSFPTPGGYDWVVPAGVNSATFTVVGARGGNSASSDGGEGGTVVTTLALTPGETLRITVGGSGADTPAIAGGFNGGGLAGSQTCVIPPSTAYCNGGGGGGASDVRRGGTAPTDRVLVAGGGGGAGGRSADGCLGEGCVPATARGGGDGGAGGNPAFNGSNGQNGGAEVEIPSSGGCGGGGATAAAPGTAGGTVPGMCSGLSGNISGGSGGTGGRGGDAAGGGSGGGGGGGFFGGGGGSGASGIGPRGGGGGGGGGSNFVTPSATGVTSAGGGGAGDGYVTITYGGGSGPAIPQIVSSTPASPANANAPKLKGTTDPGTTVTLYASGNCSGTAAGSGPAATFTGAGIGVAVADDSTTTFTAKASNGSGTSGCSAPFVYSERTPPKISLSGDKSQKLGQRVVVDAKAVTEETDIAASGVVKIPGPDQPLSATRKPAAAGQTVTLKLRLQNPARKKIEKAMKRGAKPVAQLSVTGTDAIGERVTLTREVRITD